MNALKTDGRLAKKAPRLGVVTKRTTALNTDSHLAKSAPCRKLCAKAIANNTTGQLIKGHRKLQYPPAITIDAGGRAHIGVELAFTSKELKVEAEMFLSRSDVPVSLSCGPSIVNRNKNTQGVLETPRHHLFSYQLRRTQHDPRQLGSARQKGPNPRKHPLTDSDVPAVEQKPETQQQIGRRGLRREMEEEDRKSLSRRRMKKNVQATYSQPVTALFSDNIKYRLRPRRDAGSMDRTVASTPDGLVLPEHKLSILSEDIFN